MYLSFIREYDVYISVWKSLGSVRVSIEVIFVGYCSNVEVVIALVDGGKCFELRKKKGSRVKPSPGTLHSVE